MYRSFLVLCLIFLFLLTKKGYAQQDSVLFSYEAYLSNLMEHHPIARQADLKTKLAEAEWLGAKGNFDPVVTSDWNQKNFDNKLYYRQFNAGVKVPTRLGIDLVAGYENTEGVFLNPEETTDPFGLWNMGVEVNLLQGLLINDRQTALAQARIFRDIAQQQRLIMLNDLVYQASLAYLNWQQYYFFQEVLQENIEIAETYSENTKASFRGGEKSAMDTLEASILLQDAQNLLATNTTSLIKARQLLATFIWLEEEAVLLPPFAQPQDWKTLIFNLENTAPIASLTNNHPLLLEKQNKRASYEVEQRLKREKLKPKLKAKYNPLFATRDTDLLPTYTSSDYKWGFDFSIPIFLRTERADIQKGAIKIQEIELDINQKQNELFTKAQAALQQIAVQEDQLNLQEQNVAAYQNLLDGEQQKFLFGESSVFLLNKRQEKYINGRLKLIALRLKLEQARLQYLYYTNTLLN